ncbi:LOW QUALITY PROTEIN: hypothetical protein MSG28_003774 [Choristoneura fumiferana]|uniref:Uncharacterized protein n=1 Tax=Choristoneura fumiferana TaxID=7141 RepID=A0ACC0KGY4_CHOFU|nr:LOW QUALITY PROTEIN: hypothetical protein MSG28_003774 [Choristoneura fumiferana]
MCHQSARARRRRCGGARSGRARVPARARGTAGRGRAGSRTGRCARGTSARAGAQAALHHHRAPVLCCAPRHARHKLVTGWSVVGGGSLVAGSRTGRCARGTSARPARRPRCTTTARRAVLRAATRQAQAGHRLWGGGSLVAGVADGSLRAWDERAPGAQAALHHHRARAVLRAATRQAQAGHRLVSSGGGVAGGGGRGRVAARVGRARARRAGRAAPPPRARAVLRAATRQAQAGHRLVSSGGGSLVAGVADGSLRAWDERAPGAQAALHHHRAPVLCCAPRHARHKLVTGWSVVGGGSLVAGVADGSLARVGRARARRAGRAAPPRAPVLCCAPRHARHKLVTGWSVGGGVAGGGGRGRVAARVGRARARRAGRAAPPPRARAVLRAATRQAQAGHRLERIINSAAYGVSAEPQRPQPFPRTLWLGTAQASVLEVFVSRSMNGEIRIYDTRAMDAPAETLRAPGPLAAVAVHPLLDLIACGSVNQSISLFELGGAPLNTIKFHEGFMGMGARIGPVRDGRRVERLDGVCVRAPVTARAPPPPPPPLPALTRNDGQLLATEAALVE